MIGGKQYLVSCKLSRNGLFISTDAHIDGGANLFGAIRTLTACKIAKAFGITFVKLPFPFQPTGYDGRPGLPITHAILLTLNLQERRINFPFLVTDLGHNDILIGKKFLQHYGIVQHYATGDQNLIWPPDMPPTPYFGRELFLDKDNWNLSPSLKHMQDAQRRDIAIDKEDTKFKNINRTRQIIQSSEKTPPKALEVYIDSKSPITPTSPKKNYRPSNFIRDLKKSVEKMEKLLCSSKIEPNVPCYPLPKLTNTGKKPSKVKIASISATAMDTFYLKKQKTGENYNQRQDYEIYICSISDIDHELHRRNQEKKTKETVIAEMGISNISSEKLLEAKYIQNDALVSEKLPRCYLPWKNLFSKRASDNLPESRSSDHKIELTEENNLKFEPLRRQTEDQLRETKRYLLENLQKGFIAPSNAPFAAPILFVKKKDGSLRFCVDYRKLNALTKKDPYLLPLIDEMMARISQARWFTKLDVQQAFHRIRLAKEAEQLTSFRTRYGCYQYRVMPFGLTNGPATFQRFINDILMECLDEYCSSYIDDILIYSSTRQEHETHVKRVMSLLVQHGLQIDIKKSEFFVQKTKFLGFIIGVDGIQVDPEKIAVINDWKYADNVRSVQAFLGFCNFYRRFIKDYSRITRPLTKLTCKNANWNFDDNCKAAWENLKNHS